VKNSLIYIIFILIGVCLIGYGAFGAVNSFSSDSEKEESSEKNEDNASDENGSNNTTSTGSVCGGTGYVSSSKRSAYIDTMAGYIDSIRTKVNMAEDFQLYDDDTLYLIPVGSEGKCAFYERGGGPVFGENWKYLYVGVTYNGMKYDYYVISLDDSGCGIDFISDDDLYKTSGDIVKKGNLSVDLTSIYASSKKNTKYANLAELTENTNGYQSFDEVPGLNKMAEIAERKYVDIISACNTSSSFY